MPTRNVNLTDRLDRFVETRVRSGSFSNASEVVREALRLLEQRDAEDSARLEWLRSAAHDAFAALDRGEGETFQSIDDLDASIDRPVRPFPQAPRPNPRRPAPCTGETS